MHLENIPWQERLIVAVTAGALLAGPTWVILVGCVAVWEVIAALVNHSVLVFSIPWLVWIITGGMMVGGTALAWGLLEDKEVED